MKLSKMFPVIFLLVAQVCLAQVLKKEDIEQLKFRHIGPVGNRVS